MSTINFITDKIRWERGVRGYSNPTFLQSWNWGETHANLGKKVFRCQLSHGIAQFIKEEAKRGTHLICPGGPLIPWEARDLVEFKNLCKELSLQEKAIFVRVRPNIPDSPENRELARMNGFSPAPMHMNAEITWKLDLSPTEDELLKGMRKTTRYLIRKAQSMGVVIEKSSKISDVELLYQLELETARRHSFVPFPLKFLQSHFDAFIKDEQIILLKGIWKNKVVSVAMIVFYDNEAVYHYSGSSTEYSDVPVNYLLQWEAIKEAKTRGMKIYNFWGIAPTDNQKHRFAGVTTFKKGFGGYRTDYLHAQDFPISFMYYPALIFESARKLIRRL